MASLRVAVPCFSSTDIRFAPSIFILAAFCACLRTSSAPHEYVALHSEEGGYSSAVATPCIPVPVSAIRRFLPMAPREQNLPDRVVYLVRTGVVEVLALQIDLRAAAIFAEPARVEERRRPADIVAHYGAVLLPKRRVGDGLQIEFLEFFESRHQRFGDILPAVDSVSASVFRLGVHFRFFIFSIKVSIFFKSCCADFPPPCCWRPPPTG